MDDKEKLMERASGMITSGQAEELIEEIGDDEEQENGVSDTANIASVLEFIKMKGKSENLKKLVSGDKDGPYLVDVRDRIYRIFNPLRYDNRGREVRKRTVVLGSEGLTMNLVLRDKLVDFIDINAFERGDMVSVKNVRIDFATGELAGTPNTVINKIMPVSLNEIVTDFSLLSEKLRNISIVGRVLEIGAIRYVNKLGSDGQIAVTECVLSGSKNSVSVSLWGSSALQTAKMNINDAVKIEFCSVRSRNNGIEIYANDLSRVLASKKLESKLKR